MYTPGLHNKIPAQKIFARGWVAQEPICSYVVAKTFQGLGPKRRESCNGDRVLRRDRSLTHVKFNRVPRVCACVLLCASCVRPVLLSSVTPFPSHACHIMTSHPITSYPALPPGTQRLPGIPSVGQCICNNVCRAFRISI